MNKVMELEHLEATLASWADQEVIVRVPLFGDVEMTFLGKLISQMDNNDDPQFIIFRAGQPALSFKTKDVWRVQVPNVPMVGGFPTVKQIFLSARVDRSQVV